MNDDVRLMLGDCLERMSEIADQSVDLVLCDLPYGTTACAWDSVIPFEPLWAHYWRVCRGAIVLTSAFPFTAVLCTSQIKYFKYSLVWDKVNKYTGALNANRMPLRRHEDLLVFYKKLPVYNKQYREGKPFTSRNNNGHGKHTQYGIGAEARHTVNNGNHNPCSVIEIKGDNKLELGLHPTQKPVALMEYMVRTYTNPGELVLDNCMGSGTTGVACVQTGRRFIGIERDPAYLAIAERRIGEAKFIPAIVPATKESVVRAATVYEAFDGKQFPNKEECARYEAEHAESRLVGLTAEQVRAALSYEDVELAAIIEKFGVVCAQARRATGDLKRRKPAPEPGEESAALGSAAAAE